MDPNQLLFIIARFMLERLETLTPGFQVPRKALEGTASLVYCYFRQLELLLLVRTPRSARQSYRFCRSRRVTITFPKHFLHGDEDTYFFPGKIGMFISHLPFTIIQLIINIHYFTQETYLASLVGGIFPSSAFSRLLEHLDLHKIKEKFFLNTISALKEHFMVIQII